MNRQAREVLHGLDIDIDVTRPLGSYSIAIQQMAAIARALVISSAKVLVLDEPTSSLTVHETEQLFRVMRKLRDEGIAVLFITHFLDQVYEVSDRVTVLRNGALVGVYETASLPRLTLITLMLGRSLTAPMTSPGTSSRAASTSGPRHLLEAEGIGLAGSIAPFDLVLHAARWSAWRACSAPDGPRSRSCCSGSTSRPTGHDVHGRHAGRRSSRRSARSSAASPSAPRTGRPRGSWPS